MTKPAPYTHVPAFEWDDATVKSLKLRPRQCFCRPYALAVVNEMTCFEANEAYRKLHRSHRRIGYTGREDMEMAFRSDRFPKHIPFSKFIPVGKCIRERGKYHWKDRPTLKSLGDHLKPRRLYIVGLYDHFVTINSSTMQVCDAFSRGWVDADKHPYACCIVNHILEARVLDVEREAAEAYGVETAEVV